MKLNNLKRVHHLLALTALCAAPAVSAQDEQAEKKPQPAAAAQEAGAEPEKPAEPSVEEAAQILSKNFGYQVGKNFKSQQDTLSLSKEEFLAGFETGFTGGELGVDTQKVQAAQMVMQKVVQEKEAKVAEENKKKSDAYIEQTAQKEGVTKTESGLLYEVLEPGGEQKYTEPKDPTKASQTRFQVRYKGTTIDGEEFDASPGDKPVPMTLNVIPGFKEALTTMPVGAKWRLHIPSELAYGPQRRSELIGPNSALVFELELVEIVEPGVSKPVQIPPQQQRPQQAQKKGEAQPAKPAAKPKPEKAAEPAAQ